MTNSAPAAELSLKAFAESLMPGKGRTDNLFKFVTALEDAEIAEVLSGLFREVGRLVDGEIGPGELEDWLLEQEAWARTLTAERQRGPGGLPAEPLAPPPWAPLRRPLAEARVALFTSGAIRRPVDPSYLADGVSYEEALTRASAAYDRFPRLRVLPADVRADKLLVEHIAYDVRAARRDVNVIFPIERLRELAAAGVVGGVADQHYAFSGLTNHERLLEVLPEWAARVAADRPDAVVVTPG